MNFIVFIIALIVLLHFQWARRNFFIRSVATPTSRHGLGPLGTIVGTLVLGHLLFTELRIENFLVALGVFLMIFSLCIFYWAIKSYSGRRPNIATTPTAAEHINQNGPYRYIRHPFYFSYICFWLGSVTIIHTVDVLIGVCILCFIYYKVALEEEKEFLLSELHDEYRLYIKKTGMLFPRIY